MSLLVHDLEHNGLGDLGEDLNDHLRVESTSVVGHDHRNGSLTKVNNSLLVVSGSEEQGQPVSVVGVE